MWANFNLDEFECKCGCGQNRILHTLIDELQMARDIAGVPFVIRSGYRCITHNMAVGGASKSAHLAGEAVDIECTDSRTRYLILNALLARDFNRIGLADTFIHADISDTLPKEVVWLYT